MSNNTLQRYDSIESAKNLPGATLENPRPDTFDDKVRLNFKRKLVFKDPNTNNKRRKKQGGKSLTKKRKTKKRRKKRKSTRRKRKRRRKTRR